MDNRIEKAAWPELKATTPAGQLPVLEVKDEGVYFQSKAIENYVARVAGLYPADAATAVKVDIIRESVVDLSTPYAAAIFGPEDKKEEALKAFYDNVAPVWLARFEDMLSKNGGVYSAGSTTLVSDIVLFSVGETLSKFKPELLEAYPLLKALKERIGSVPSIAAYRAAHPL